MENLEKLYRNLIASPEKWRYYNGQYADFEQMFRHNRCELFITDSLIRAGKDKVGLFTESIAKLSATRKHHIVSCYFFGLLIYNNNEMIKSLINAQVYSLKSNRNDESIENKFYYLWMLICLFHDLGYALEEDSIQYEEINDLLKEITPKQKYLPSVYNKRLLKSYWDYRWCKWNVQDHGIIGGLRFFKEMCKLRNENYKDCNKDSPLYWGKELEKDYACAAWIIACHNIFIIKSGSTYECCYKHFHLDSLITKERLIKIKLHPIFFLFCLVDSIEPIKVLGDYSLLDKIEIQFVGQNTIEIRLDRLPNKTKERMINIGLGLNEWLIHASTDKNNNKLILNLES